MINSYQSSPHLKFKSALIADGEGPTEMGWSSSQLHQQHDVIGFETTKQLATTTNNFIINNDNKSNININSKVCNVCNKTFSRVWSLQRHMADRHFYIPQNIECDLCGRTYRSRNSLISHKSQYHGGGISSKINKNSEKIKVMPVISDFNQLPDDVLNIIIKEEIDD